MKVKYTPKRIVVALLLFVALSCEETTIIKQYTGTGEEKTYSIEGYAQKGPFIVGTDVTVSELSDDLYPTGRVFFATILNDDGYFELPGVVLASPYVQIKVRGRYFSETGGYVPTEELTLYSLADVTNSETINVNILTHLEKERVEYLVQEDNKSFNDAKAQAQDEILKVFSWDDMNLGSSENLNLSSNDTGGAVLLAMSSIFEAIDFILRLEMLTNFKVDFAQDGHLNNESIKNRLLTSASILNPFYVRENMEWKYNTTMPPFEDVLQAFITKSPYVNNLDEVFPKEYNGYTNLFRLKKDDALNVSTNYALIINPAPDGVSFAQTSRTIYFKVTLSCNADFPLNSINNFEFANPNWNSQWGGWSVGQCSNLPNEFCASTVWGAEIEPENLPLLIPVKVTGDGNVEMHYQLDIDAVFTSNLYSLHW